jgi:hypothetical protein
MGCARTCTAVESYRQVGTRVAPVAYRELLRCGRNRWNLDAASDRDALLIYSVSVKSEAYSLFSHNVVALEFRCLICLRRRYDRHNALSVLVMVQSTWPATTGHRQNAVATPLDRASGDFVPESAKNKPY